MHPLSLVQNKVVATDTVTALLQYSYIIGLLHNYYNVPVLLMITDNNNNNDC